MVSVAIEKATGVVVIAVPAMAGRVLLGTELSDSGVAVGRLGGCGSLAPGLSCWRRCSRVRY